MDPHDRENLPPLNADTAPLVRTIVRAACTVVASTFVAVDDDVVLAAAAAASIPRISASRKINLDSRRSVQHFPSCSSTTCCTLHRSAIPVEVVAAVAVVRPSSPLKSSSSSKYRRYSERSAAPRLD